MNARTARRLAIALATVTATYLWSIGAQATGTGKSFTSLASGFTQDLHAVTGDFVDPEFGILGGVAFGPSAAAGQPGDVWSAECYFYGTRLHRFAKDVTEVQHGTTVHHDNVVDISELGPYGSVLPYGAGGCGLVNHPDGFMYSTSMWGVWKLDPATGAPIDPATDQPIDPSVPVADWHTYLVGGTSAQGANALGIAVDPHTWAADAVPTKHLVYVGADCHPSLSPQSTTCTLFDLNPKTGVTSVFARMSRPAMAFIDGLYFDPSGDYLLAAYRDEAFDTPQNALYVFRRPTALGALNAPVDDTQVVTKVMMTSEPDGVAFHATQGFVVTLNESDDGPTKAGTMTRFDFGNGFDHQPTAVSEFASGGFRGDLLQVGIDGCIYATQGRLFSRDPDMSASRYDDLTTDAKNGVVQICGGFAAAPGASGNNESAAGSVSGVVYVDQNRNQQYDAGEQVLAGVTVTLDGPNGQQTTTSGTDGSYSFGSLTAGGYSVSSPTEAQGLQLFTASPITFTLAANEQKTGVDFGYVPGSVSGYAYVDENRNMVFDAGEAVISNVTLTLTGGGTTMTAVTDATGKYVFPSVPAGTYDDTAPASANGMTLFTPSPLSVTVAAGEDKNNYNFGYVPPGSITGTVFTDTNGNGSQDSGEPGIPGVTVTGPNGQTTTTDSNGSFTFTDVPPGTYTITTPVTPPTTVTVNPGETTSGVNLAHAVGSLSGFAYVDANRNSVKDAGEAGIGGVTIAGPGGATASTAADGSYSFANLETGTYSVSAPATASGLALFTASPLSVAVTAGQNSPNNNFGYVSGGITGTVFTDTNNNGTRDSGEPGMPGVTVTGPNGQTTTTDSNGNFTFTDVPGGTYTVDTPVTPPTTVTVTPGQTTSGVDLAHAVGSLSGFAYVDANRNSVKDAGEAGIGGVAIAGPAGATTTTAADGSYSFVNLETGTYGVSAPATASGLALFTASPLSVAVTAGQNSPNNNFGYVSGGITGTVFTDTNNNGTRDSGEPGLPGVTVTGPNGQTTTTDSNGNFTFTDVPGGTYTVDTPVTPPTTVTVTPGQTTTGVTLAHEVGSLSGFAYVDANRNSAKDAGEAGIGGVTITGPSGATTTTAADGSYSFVNLETGTYGVGAPATASGLALFTASPLSVAVTAGQNSPNNNFGYVSGGITGTVFTDTNNNGTRDSGEPGLPGVTVTGPNGQTTTTDSNGNFTFTNVPGGTYTVDTPVTPPTTVTVTPGQTTTGVTLAHPVGSLSGFTYVDSNKNSVKDAGEPGIGGVVVTGPAGATTTTAADGSYSFGNLETGTYSVSAPATASGKARFTPSPLSVAVTAGQNSPNNNFGYVPGAISGFTYLDANMNSVKDAGEPGIGGVVVTGPAGATATTAADGSYSFGSLDAGTYSVSAPATAAGKARFTASPLSATVVAGGTTPNVNFGYVQGGLSGFVYVDANRNMVKDAGEAGIAGVVVTGPGGTRTTAADGSYSFANLDAGTYSVSSPATASGYGLETPSPLAPVVTAGQNTPNVNFGYVSGTITGTVFDDVNENGVQDAGEPPISGVTITLSNGTTTTSGTNGTFTFTNVPAGTYTVTAPAVYNNTGRVSVGSVTVTVPPGGTVTGVNFRYHGRPFVTYTVGGWGAKPSGNNGGALLKTYFAAVYPNGVTIGGSPYYLKFTSSTAVKNFLNSSGGTPGVLTASATNPTNSSAGNFADQVLALKLSVDFSNAGKTTPGLGSRRINPGFPLAGWTVNQVLTAAMQVLAGNLSALPPGQTVGSLTTLISSLNNNYDAGILNLDVCGK